MNKDIVIFTNGNLFAQVILNSFIQQYSHRIACVVLVTGDYKGNGGFDALYKYFKSVTFPFFIYKITTLLIIKFLKIYRPKRIWNVKSCCINNGIETILEVTNIKDESLFEKINSLNATYLISVSCPQFISKKWLEVFKYKAINIHSSDLPAYAGLAPYYWVLVNNETKTATTVHYITPKFDAGNILEKSDLKIEHHTSVFKLFYRLSQLGEKALLNAFEKLELGHNGEDQDLSKYSYYSNPDFQSYIKLKKNGFCLIKASDIKTLIQST
jgi:folate-dependent phosphoribosylglycinamide formyltransferase PurN